MQNENLDQTTGEILECQDTSTLGPPVLSESVEKIIPALCQARKEMDTVGFNGWNDKHNYAFRKAVDIYAATGPALANNEIMVIPSVLQTNESDFMTNNQSKMVLTGVTMVIMLVHKSGEFIKQHYRATALDTMDKGIFKAYTSCLKYHLLMTFQLGGEDVENEQSGSGNNGCSGRQQGRSQGSGSRSGKPPIKTATITTEQAENLKNLILLSGYGEKNVLGFYKVDQIVNLPVVKYNGAVSYLQKAIKKKNESVPSNANSSSENVTGNVPSDTTTATQSDPSPQLPSVSLEQVQKLEGLIKEAGADEAKFLIHLQVETLAHLPADRFDEAVKALDAKKKKNNENANCVQGAVNQLIATLSARNIAFKVDEASGDVQATPGYQDTQGKAFLKSLGFKQMIGGKTWIKEAA